MKILYICHEPLPSQHTNTEQIIKTLAALAAASQISIDLIYPRNRATQTNRSLPAAEIADFYDVPCEIFRDRINLIELPIPFFIPKKLRLVYHDLRAARWAGRSDYDLVYTRDYFSLAAVLLWGKRAVFETYRYDISTARRLSLWRRFCYPHRNLVGIITHSELARRSFLQAGIPAHKVITVYNGGFYETLPSQIKRENARQKLGLPAAANILLYTGHINRKKGIEVLVSMAALLPDVQFVLVGGLSGSREFQKLQSSLDRSGPANIQLIPRVPPAQVFLFLAAADLLLIPPTSRPLSKFHRTCLPIKAFRYLAAGRPILAPDTPDIREVLKHRFNAFLVPPDVLSDSVKGVQELLQDQDLRDLIAANALVDAQNYSWQKRGQRIAELLKTWLPEKAIYTWKE